MESGLALGQGEQGSRLGPRAAYTCFFTERYSMQSNPQSECENAEASEAEVFITENWKLSDLFWLN